MSDEPSEGLSFIEPPVLTFGSGDYRSLHIASPADVRNNLDPAVVDALADQLHMLRCLVIGAPPQQWPDHHRDADRSHARFLLLGLRETGWQLVRGS